MREAAGWTVCGKKTWKKGLERLWHQGIAEADFRHLYPAPGMMPVRNPAGDGDGWFLFFIWGRHFASCGRRIWKWVCDALGIAGNPE